MYLRVGCGTVQACPCDLEEGVLASEGMAGSFCWSPRRLLGCVRGLLGCIHGRRCGQRLTPWVQRREGVSCPCVAFRGGGGGCVYPGNVTEHEWVSGCMCAWVRREGVSRGLWMAWCSRVFEGQTSSAGAAIICVEG